ncbi:MAG TPA: hypothetical protein VGL59_21065, partial [Polyangia bacterium]
MRGQKRTLIIGAALLATATIPPGSSQAAPAGEAPGTFRVGLNLVPEPFGQFTFSGQILGVRATASQDTAFAFGFAPYIDYNLLPNFFLGFQPVYSVHVKPDLANADAGEQLDLLIRAGGQFELVPRLWLYGYLAPGYSVIMVPHADNPSGLVFGFHVGAAYDVTRTIYANFQLGYQWG